MIGARATTCAAFALLVAIRPVPASPSTCPAGRFDVDGAPLVGDGPWDQDAVVIDLPGVSTESGCPPELMHARASGRSVRVRARWSACQGGVTAVRLAARIARRGCARLRGVLRFRRNGRREERRFTARRVVAGSAGIIPRPATVWSPSVRGTFAIDAKTEVLVEAGDPAVREVATALDTMLARQGLARRGIGKQHGPRQRAGSILLTTAGADARHGREGYQLVVTPQRITIRAPHPAGLFYGVQSLRQLLPTAIEDLSAAAGVTWEVPALRIEDSPRFPWRGLMLDVSRTFYPKTVLLRYIDLLALHKMNVFHLHLTDDQGWRVEIDAFPQLHMLGSQMDPDRFPDEPGGYFTKEDLREIVGYAASRHVDVVPEIDMPGHSVAALHAMPELACTRSPDHRRSADEFPIVPLFTAPPIREQSLCVCDERVYEAMQTVLEEVIDIFPSRYVHIGGDEVSTTEWASSYKCHALMQALGLHDIDQMRGYFTRRIGDFLRARGKVTVVWDDVLPSAGAAADARTQLASDALVMHWRDFPVSPDGLHDRDVVEAPFSALYLDYKGTPLTRTYGFEPVPPGITPEQALRVRGAQGNMWTQFSSSRSQAGLDGHVFPRLLAIAELTWSSREQRDFADFEVRRQAHTVRLDVLGVARP